jgi:chromosome segregation ATPase
MTEQKERVEFLDKVNSTDKTFGHNKFQIEIQELQEEINKFKSLETEQNNKLELLKKTITTLQEQCHDKEGTIAQLKQVISQMSSQQIIKQTESSGTIDELQANNQKLNSELQAECQKTSEYTKTISDQCKEIEAFKNEIIQHHTTITTLKDQLQKSVETVMQLRDQKQQAESSKSNTMNVNEKLEKDLDTVTAELVQFKSDNNDLLETIANKTSIEIDLRQRVAQLELDLEKYTTPQKPQQNNNNVLLGRRGQTLTSRRR